MIYNKKVSLKVLNMITWITILRMCDGRRWSQTEVRGSWKLYVPPKAPWGGRRIMTEPITYSQMDLVNRTLVFSEAHKIPKGQGLGNSD